MLKKFETLSDLISTSMQGNKRIYAFKLLNDIVDRINYDEVYFKNQKIKKLNIEYEHFDLFLEKVVYCLQILGFDKTEMMNYNDDALIFLAKNRHLIKKPLTAEYFNTLQLLYSYYETMNGNKPKTLKDLKNAYTEIEDNRIDNI